MVVPWKNPREARLLLLFEDCCSGSPYPCLSVLKQLRCDLSLFPPRLTYVVLRTHYVEVVRSMVSLTSMASLEAI